MNEVVLKSKLTPLAARMTSPSLDSSCRETSRGGSWPLGPWKWACLLCPSLSSVGFTSPGASRDWDTFVAVDGLSDRAEPAGDTVVAESTKIG